MRIVRWLGGELAGAWRSVRYDLTRRPNPAKQPTEVLYPEYDAYHQRPPRRWYAAAGLGLVVAAGVAATYVAVAGGLGAVFTPIVNAVPGLSDAAPAKPPAATQTPADRPDAGRVPAAASAAPAARRAADTAAPAAPAAPVAQPSCLCPVPVPTPQSPTPTPSNPPSPSPTPSVSHSPSPSPIGSTAAQP